MGTENSFEPGREHLELLACAVVNTKAVVLHAEAIARSIFEAGHEGIVRAKQFDLPELCSPAARRGFHQQRRDCGMIGNFTVARRSIDTGIRELAEDLRIEADRFRRNGLRCCHLNQRSKDFRASRREAASAPTSVSRTQNGTNSSGSGSTSLK